MDVIALVAKYNGWNMAFAGMTIVFSCLVVLSFAISRIHLMIEVWENRKDWTARFVSVFSVEKKKGAEPALVISSALRESARRFRLFSRFVGEPFHLSDLIGFAEKRGMTTPCPRRIIDDLLKAKLIVSKDNKRFSWDKSLCDNYL